MLSNYCEERRDKQCSKTEEEEEEEADALGIAEETIIIYCRGNSLKIVKNFSFKKKKNGIILSDSLIEGLFYSLSCLFL